MKYKHAILIAILSFFTVSGYAGYHDPSLNTYGGKHIIEFKAPTGESITIEDGSVWTVHPSHEMKVASWHEKQVIQIRVRDEFLDKINPLNWNLWGKKPSYLYEIKNLTTNQRVPVRLSLGPIKSSPCRRTITAINPFQGIIYLNDNSAWKVSRKITSRLHLSKYLIGDAVIIATKNDKPNFWDNSNTLINVSDNSYVEITPCTSGYGH